MKVKAYDPVVVGLIDLDEQGANTLDLAFDLLFLVLSHRRVVPLYTQVDARPVYRIPRPAHTSVRLGLFLSLTYNTSYTSMVVYYYGP